MAREMPHVDGVEHRYVELDGVRIHLAEAGPADAPPLLLLHGWPQHWYMWRRVIEGLQGEYRLLVPDLRGFGWSDAPGHGYDAETFGADQIALLDELGIDRVHLISHDWGGWTAFLLALSNPERLNRMLVCNAPHPWPKVRPRLLAEGWRSWYGVLNATPGLGPLLHRRTGWARWILAHGSVGQPFSQTELHEFADSFREPARAAAVSALYRYYVKVFRKGMSGHWRGQRLSVPTLLLFGERDPYVTRHLPVGLERHADEGQLEFVPDCSHFIVNERPDLVVDRARSFLGGE